MIVDKPETQRPYTGARYHLFCDGCGMELSPEEAHECVPALQDVARKAGWAMEEDRFILVAEGFLQQAIDEGAPVTRFFCPACQRKGGEDHAPV